MPTCQQKDCKVEADEFYCFTCLTIKLQTAYDEGFDAGKLAGMDRAIEIIKEPNES